MQRKRILFISDSIKRKTGYATVARNLITELVKNDKYDIAQLGLSDIPALTNLPIWYYSQIKDHTKCCKRGIGVEYVTPTDPEIKFLFVQENEKFLKEHPKQIPCIRGINVNQDHYAYDSVYFVIKHFKPDIVVPINDLWGLYNINHLSNRAKFKFIPYLAIDSECLFPLLNPPEGREGLPPIDTVNSIGMMDKPVVFTEWAKNVINKTASVVTGGKELNHIEVIPHGVDTSIWKPIDQEKRKYLRKKIFGIDDDIFLIGSVARNQPRKRLDAIFMTLKKFINNYEKNHRKIKCYFHCSLKDNMGWDLNWLSAYYGVQDRCVYDKNLLPGVGPSDAELNDIINCFDAHLMLTNSEGWGLPALETAAAGIPNVITKYSAHADWGKDTLLFCKVAGWYHEPKTGFIKAVANINDAAKQLSLLYNSKKMTDDYKKRGIKLGNILQWKNVAKKWEKLFDAVDISDLEKDRWEKEDIIPQQKDQPLGPEQLQLSHFPEN
jgi:glycosyltransferase involved in cell wall biosynthesis